MNTNMIKLVIATLTVLCISAVFTGCGEVAPSDCGPRKVDGAWKCICTDDEGERTANVEVTNDLCSEAPLPEGTCSLESKNGDICTFECSGLGKADVYCGDDAPPTNSDGSCQAFVGSDGTCYLACEGVDQVAFACGGSSGSTGAGGNNNGGEVCTDGVDNDADGFIDCNDANCYGHSACSGGSTSGSGSGSTGSGGSTNCTPTGYWLCEVNGNCYQELCAGQVISKSGHYEVYSETYCNDTVKVSAQSGSVGGTVSWGWNGNNWAGSAQYQATPGNPAYADFDAYGCSMVVGGSPSSVVVLPYGSN